MDHTILIPDSKPKIDNYFLQKMIILHNALEDGWEIKKNNNKYILSKKHEGRKEIYLDNYLEKFLEKIINKN